MFRNTVSRMAKMPGTRRARSHSMTGRLSTARKSAMAEGSRIGAAKRIP
jgi:hypothetical protein